MFINIEGVNGVGKSTVISIIDSELSKFYETEVIHFPRYDSLLGDTIKNILNNNLPHLKQYLQILCSIDRINFTNEYKNTNKCIIADRYLPSGIVYTSLQDPNYLQLLQIIERDILVPDYTFILIADDDVISERILKRNRQKTMFENINELRKQQFLFLDIPYFIPEFNITYINANDTPQSIADEILSKIRSSLK